MVWLIGHKGMLGSEVYNVLTKNKIPFFYSDSEVDITDAKTIEQLTKYESIEWIINCAAFTDVEVAEDHPDKALEINGHSLQNLINVAKVKDAKIIHISSDYVFDGKKFEGYIESDETNPISKYGYSKVVGEQILIQNYHKYIILRTSWLYGKGGVNFIYTILKLLGAGNVVSIVDDQTGSPTYSCDVAKVIGYLIAVNADKYGVYHCSNSGQTDWFEYAQTIFEKSLAYNVLPGWIQSKTKIVPISSSQYQTKAQRPKNSYLISTKLGTDYKVHMRPWPEALDAFFKTIQKKKG